MDMKIFIIEADIDDGDIYFTVKREGQKLPFACIGKTSRTNGGGYHAKQKGEAYGYVWISTDEYLLTKDEERYLKWEGVTLEDYHTCWTDAACYVFRENSGEFYRAADDAVKAECGLTEKEFAVMFEWEDVRARFKSERWERARNAIKADAEWIDEPSDKPYA